MAIGPTFKRAYFWHVPILGQRSKGFGFPQNMDTSGMLTRKSELCHFSSLDTGQADGFNSGSNVVDDGNRQTTFTALLSSLLEMWSFFPDVPILFMCLWQIGYRYILIFDRRITKPFLPFTFLLFSLLFFFSVFFYFSSPCFPYPSTSNLAVKLSISHPFLFFSYLNPTLVVSLLPPGLSLQPFVRIVSSELIGFCF